MKHYIVEITSKESPSVFPILELVASFLTPIIVIIIGLILSKKLERIKLNVLKEKEWQVKWADLFLNNAIEFNRNVSIIVASMYKLQSSTPEITEVLKKSINQSIYALQDIEWDIKNFSQFGKTYNSKLVAKQHELFSKVNELTTNKKGDLEEIRTLQFEYNQIVRRCHNEILNSTIDLAL